MRTWLIDYISGCATCQQNKILTHRQRTPIYRIPTTENTLPFQHISLDLITQLPKSQGHDAVLTIVDHGCTCAAVFLPCSTMVTGPGIAQLYLDNVYRWFGLPSKLISDCDTHFTSYFGKALALKLGITQNLSTAFHPQTDGLSERKNQWVEQYLRLITSGQQSDWADWLTIATAVHNKRYNETIKMTPNEALLGYQPMLAPDQQVPTNNEAAETRLQRMEQYHVRARAAINIIANNREIPMLRYKTGDKVWLEATHLNLPYQTPKLAPKCQGPFNIVNVVSPVAYHLQLPAAWNIHDVFHASLLTPYRDTASHGPNFTRPPPDLVQGNKEFEVETIINHRFFGRRKTLQYLIKWKGYPSSDNTWEPVDNVHAPEIVKQYHQRRPLEDKSKKKPSRVNSISTTSLFSLQLWLTLKKSSKPPPLHSSTSSLPLTVATTKTTISTHTPTPSSPLGALAPTLRQSSP